jgi:cell division protein ZipA
MELRWGLLFVGLILLLFVYIYSRYRQELETFFEAISRPRAPVESSVNADADRQEDPDRDESGPDQDTVAPPAVPEIRVKKVVAIRMMSGSDGGFSAETLILALREAGLRHGKFGIFHRPAGDDDRCSDFSVASLIEPGSFDLTRVKTEFYPGVSIFLRLPGPDNALNAFDDMLQISKSLAAKLDAELLDEQGSTLSIQRERYMREEVIQFQHQVN